MSNISDMMKFPDNQGHTIIPSNRSFDSSRATLHEATTSLFEFILFSFIVLVGVATFSLKIAVLKAVSFSSWASAFVPLLILSVLFLMHIAKERDFFSGIKGKERLFLLQSLLLCVLGAFFAIAINLPNLDDSVYVPKPLYYIENPHAILDNSVTWIVMPGRILHSGVFPYYEIFQAAFAYYCGAHFLFFYHIVFPFAVGFLTVLSMILLARIFHSEANGVLVGTLLFIFFALMLGETIRTYGNLSFARAFQGKFMFLTVGVTTWVYFSVRFFIERDSFSWLALFLLGIGMACTTTSALVFLPLLCAMMILSHGIQEYRKVRLKTAFKTYGIYAAALIPLLLMGIEFVFYAWKNLRFGSSINSGFPQQFAGQMGLLINHKYPLTPVLFFVSAGIVFICSPFRLFFITWVLFGLSFLLNPLTAPFVIKYVTTENLYWRLFYILPFPLVVTLAGAILQNQLLRNKAVSCALLLTIAYLSCCGPTSVVRSEYGATIAFPQYKIPAEHYSASQEVLLNSSPGPMLAPLDIASTVLLLSSKYPQIYMRDDYLRFILESSGFNDEYVCRRKAVTYLYEGDKAEDMKQCFADILKSASRPQSIVIPANAFNLSDAVRLLKNEGYNSVRTLNSGYQVYSRE